jgi:hypothetical protein
LFLITRRLCRDLQTADRIEAIQEEAEEEAERERELLASRAAS